MIEIFDLGPVGNGRLATMTRPSGNDWLDDDVRAITGRVDLIVSMLTAAETDSLGLRRERQACTTAGMSFLNVPLPDRTTPTSSRAFEAHVRGIAAHIDEGRSVAIHCRAGIGRSSLMAASVLVLWGATPSSAWARIGSARGRPVPDTNEQREWLNAFASYLTVTQR